jgi:AbiV family abortive infection protein
VTGIQLVRENARRLILDADLMLQHQRYPAACQLAILAIEELGKEAILRNLAAVDSDGEVQKCWRDFRIHRAKNTRWLGPGLADEGWSILELVAAQADPGTSQTIETYKQLCTYVDLRLGRDGKAWKRPALVASKSFAEFLIESARRLDCGLEVTPEALTKHTELLRRLNEAETQVDKKERFKELYRECAGLSDEDIEALFFRRERIDLRGVGKK